MAKEKLTLEDIFNDDELGILESTVKTSTIKTDDDRIIDAFEEINVFYDKNGREPSTSSMSEFTLSAKLKNFRQDNANKLLLKSYDRHNLLGEVEVELSVDDILNDDEFGFLDLDEDLSIFEFKHTPKPSERTETDFVAKRKSMKEKDFRKYETMFHKVHEEIKEGKRKIKGFNYESLKEKHFYVNQGVLLYLESVKWDKKIQKFKSGVHNRPDGRCKIIFENGTKSNMRFQSLYKTLHADGKLVTDTFENSNYDLFVNTGMVQEEDIQTGWIYVLKSKSTNPKISSIQNLYKIGFSSSPVDDRIKNAKNEATYLFSDVQKVTSYKCYNRNADKLEGLLHKFFAAACLNIDLFDKEGQRLNPREWFVVPLEVIEEAINLIIKESIINYRYDVDTGSIVLK